ncbi:hypothetical protein K443DRAFT_268831 [Laccaria amethystina LaAM-08-1]|uniref:Uncharacterized protein n=1 Tax=Laccaria amethystina LaAM-08-1 TaxID=1095629 RepID=A0A0C9WL58_9AGAR|nr:hypothetical protein K443DRAFT_268831 [Laccaria amethystina LaAM-08-1]
MSRDRVGLHHAQILLYNEEFLAIFEYRGGCRICVERLIAILTHIADECQVSDADLVFLLRIGNVASQPIKTMALLDGFHNILRPRTMRHYTNITLLELCSAACSPTELARLSTTPDIRDPNCVLIVHTSHKVVNNVHIHRLYKTRQLAPFFLCEDLLMNFSLHLLFRDLLANGTST